MFWLVVQYMKVNGKDDIPYMKWKIQNVPNHRPATNIHGASPKKKTHSSA